VIDPIEEMRAGNLDLTKVGAYLLKLPLVAVQLGHLSLEQTDTYLHPVSLEAQFVVDVVFALTRGANRGLSTEQFARKWFDGEGGAVELLGRMLGDTSHAGTHDA
jgi:hypothetical protein